VQLFSATPVKIRLFIRQLQRNHLCIRILHQRGISMC